MPVSVIGSFPDLSRLEFSGLDDAISNKVAELIDRGFQTKTDPYGKPWAQDKNPKNSLLERTGNLRRSFKVTVENGYIVVRNSAAYADAIQAGSGKTLSRKMVPENELPESWRREIETVITGYLEEHLK